MRIIEMEIGGGSDDCGVATEKGKKLLRKSRIECLNQLQRKNLKPELNLP